jgi:hypothetical protein
MLLLVLEHAFSYGLITRIIQVELGFIVQAHSQPSARQITPQQYPELDSGFVNTFASNQRRDSGEEGAGHRSTRKKSKPIDLLMGPL